jgi:hypothetical protein
LIFQLISTNIDFYKQYNVVVNGNSGNQKYYPFNLWQFWEVTLYDLSLYNKIGKEAGMYRQSDPVTLNCNFEDASGSLITADGLIQAKLKYSCSLNLQDSNQSGKIVALKQFTFVHTLTGKFQLTADTLNAKVYLGTISVSFKILIQ